MSNTDYRKLWEWVRELSPKALFLLTFIGSAVAAGIASWIPYPSIKTIVIGIGLGMNAWLIAWLSRVRTQDNSAIIRERATLVQQIKKLQRIKEQQLMKEFEKASVDPGRQQREPSQRISGFEKSGVGPLSRTGAEDLAASPRWSIGGQDAHKQWKLLNTAEKAMVRFVLQRGTTTAAQLLQFRDPDGFRTTDTCAAVKQKTSFLAGDLDSGLTIDPRLKPYLERILVEDRSRDARSF